jgi:hypothetical protein
LNLIEEMNAMKNNSGYAIKIQVMSSQRFKIAANLETLEGFSNSASRA